jgi:hypothetical protein
LADRQISFRKSEAHAICPVLARKCFSSEFRKIIVLSAIPPRQEGRMRIVTTREAGSDGRGCVVRRATPAADGKGVWARRPSGRCQACASMTQVTVTQKPVSPERARDKPLTPLRRECRCFGFICGDYARVLSTLAYEAAGAAEHPAFPAPFSGGTDDRQSPDAEGVVGLRRRVLAAV